MSAAEGLAKELTVAQKFLTTTLGVFDEEDSGFAPQPELLTVAAHVAHIAGTVDWFIDGAFGEGWDMDFDHHISQAKAVASLDDATAWLEKAFSRAIDVVSSATDEDLFSPIADTRIMEGAPRAAVISAITDHTAHHRGALSVYVRLLGKVPIMPYV